MEDTFVAKVIGAMRVTIPKEICDLKGIHEGDYVRIKIEKAKKEA